MKLFYTFLAFLLLTSCFKKNEPSYKTTKTFFVFNTAINITLYDIKPKDKKIIDLTFEKISQKLALFDSKLSIENQNSELSQINSQSYLKEKKIEDPFLKKLFYLSDSIATITQNSFDIAIFPIVQKWGFHSGSQHQYLSKDTLAKMLPYSNHKMLEYNKEKATIKFLHPKTKVAFGSIAKGLIVDSVSSFLSSKGFTSHIVEAGGDLIVKGDSKKSIGIKNPRNETLLIDTLYVKNKAVATSGDYERFFIHQGKRYHHLINPKTGISDSDLISVTVVTDDTFLADALATAIFVMGQEKGEKFIMSRGYSAILILKEGNSLKKIDLNMKQYQSF